MADTPITLPITRTSPLSINESADFGMNSKFTILYSDIAYGTGSTDTVTVTLGTTPASWYVDKALGNVRTAFAGTTALTVAVGTTSSTTAFISAQSVLVADQLEMASTLPILTNAKGTAALSLVAVFTNATGGSPSALTAGAMDLYLNIKDTSELP
jgi:hypothetical protein